MPRASSSGGGKAGVSQRWWFGLAVLALCIGVAWLIIPGLSQGVSPEGARTIVAARALAESPLTDWLAAFRLPFLQIFFSGLVLKLFGVSDAMLYFTQFCWYALSVLLVYWLTHRQVREPYALIITVLYAMSPATLAACAAMGADMLFMVVSLSALICIDQYFGARRPDDASTGRLALCGFFVVLSVLCSQWGYALMITYWLMVLRLHSLQKSFAVLFGMLLALLPFYIWSGLYGVNGLPSIENLGWENVLTNTTYAILGTLKLQFAGLGEYDFSRWFWVRWMIGGFMLLGLMLGLVRYSGVGSVYLATSLVLMFGFLGAKNLFPVLPFMLLYLYFGLMRFGEWMAKLKLPVSKIISPVLTLFILCASATHWISSAATRLTAPNGLYTEKSGTSSALASAEKPAPPPRLGRESLLRSSGDTTMRRNADAAETPQAGYDRATRWLALNTPENATIGVSRMTRASAFYAANRPLIILPIVSSPAQLAERLLRYDFVIEQNPEAAVPVSVAGSMDAVAAMNQKRLRLVYHDPDSRIRIWRVNKL